MPFSVTLPWETPVTELAVAGAKDKGDLDQLTVGPLPVQEAVLESLGQLGFGFRSADLENGRIGGTGQQLPFFQEIELTFLASPGGMEVVLGADKRGGFFSEGRDTVTRFTVGHHDARDWNAEVDGWIRQLVEQRASYGSHAAYGPEGHRPGMGTAVAAGAAGLAVGVVGGMVAAEAVDEVGDFFEGDEEEE